MSNDLQNEAEKVRNAMEDVQRVGNYLVMRLEDYTKAGGDPHATVQALELFIRAVVRDCVTRLNII